MNRDYGRGFMRLTNEQVALRAFNIILEIMAEGSEKDGANDTWLDVPPRFHSDKSIRHQITGQLENNPKHLEYALVRSAMEICQQEYHRSIVDGRE